MSPILDPADLAGRPARDSDGRLVGDVDVVFGDRATGAPRFAGLSTPDGYVVVPLEGASVDEDGRALRLAFPGARIAGAPRVDPDEPRLDAPTEQAITRHFAGETPTAVAPAPTAAPVPAAAPAADAEADDDAELVLSEERLLVDTQRVPTDRVRLRKQIVEEEVTLTVTLRREELVVERELLGTGDALVEPTSAPGADLQEPLEILLWAEEPVVTTRSVPVERVRLRRNVTTEDREITTELRRERAEVDHPTGGTATP